MIFYWYLDDILLIANNHIECAKHVKITCELLKSLLINFKKSELQPAHLCKFLGFMLDSKSFCIYLPDNKRNHIYQIVCELLKARSIKIRRLAEIIGTLVSACLGVNYGCLYIKNLEREKFLALKTNNGDYDANTTLQDNSRVDLNWC